jgi:hypothetical protein
MKDLDIDVYSASRERIKYTFDNFERIFILIDGVDSAYSSNTFLDISSFSALLLTIVIVSPGIKFGVVVGEVNEIRSSTNRCR